MAALTTIRNIGPSFAAALQGVGIKTAEELRDIGADAAYARILESGAKPHFIGYYVLHMALQGRPWNDCKGDEKKALRKSFDKIKAQSFDQDLSEFEAILDRIGVGKRMDKS
ncbi:TfoX/Sxy family protein [Yoonia sp. BS5-3]|uniref:TfoX/Sxy family protein n=1 Tax=Yoonia phaeophyticola TaxID=3137369 RepID=A0ABZ2V2J9_9RHOB